MSITIVFTQIFKGWRLARAIDQLLGWSPKWGGWTFCLGRICCMMWTDIWCTMIMVYICIYIYTQYVLYIALWSYFTICCPKFWSCRTYMIKIWDNKFFGDVGGWCIADWPRYGQTGSGKTYTMRLLAWSGSNAGGCRFVSGWAIWTYRLLFERCLIVWIQRLVSHLPSSPWHCKMPASTCKKTCQETTLVI